MSNILTLIWITLICLFIIYVYKKFKNDKWFKFKLIIFMGISGIFYIPLTMIYCYSHPLQNVPDSIELLYKYKVNILTKAKRIDRKIGKNPLIKKTKKIYEKSGIKNMARMTTKVTNSYGIKTPIKETNDTFFTKSIKGLYKGVQFIVGVFV